MFSATRTRTMGAALRSRPRLNWIQNPVSCLHVCEFRTFKGALYITHLAHLLPASFNHTLDPAVLRTLVGSEFFLRGKSFDEPLEFKQSTGGVYD